MNIRTTTDPITLRDVTDIEDHPCIYEGDGENGIEIYLEIGSSKNQLVGYYHSKSLCSTICEVTIKEMWICNLGGRFIVS
jgi:hypothetical protein